MRFMLLLECELCGARWAAGGIEGHAPEGCPLCKPELHKEALACIEDGHEHMRRGREIGEGRMYIDGRPREVRAS